MFCWFLLIYLCQFFGIDGAFLIYAINFLFCNFCIWERLYEYINQCIYYTTLLSKMSLSILPFEIIAIEVAASSVVVLTTQQFHFLHFIWLVFFSHLLVSLSCIFDATINILHGHIFKILHFFLRWIPVRVLCFHLEIKCKK